MEVLASYHKLMRKDPFGEVSNRDRPAFPSRALEGYDQE
jgi:hypothetical protein